MRARVVRHGLRGRALFEGSRMNPIHQQATVDGLEKRRSRVLMELHPELRARVIPLLAELGGRLTPYEGFRDAAAQAKAKAAGTSKAAFGESPHNFKPALAVDVVLHPALVAVRAHKIDPSYPDLWDDESPDALAAWEALEQAAKAHGLERVNVDGKRDRPHLQLADWRSKVPQ
jgi:hypothetical protein